MECNKEEAFRAKAIAERKMQDKDFLGARKFAMKAQQLYPDTENISQMICVCDVHCSADRKIYGNESDWYGILQIEQTAEDTLIKKQYRKFALLLHPDKNKFAGAEAAFKLIGEAQRVLLDREKRSYFDLKYRTPFRQGIPNQVSQQASNSNVARQPRAQNNSTSNSSSMFRASNTHYQEPKPQVQPGTANGRETFWTLCPFCSVRYQYFKDVLNRALRCQSCKKPFIAYDTNTQGAQPGSDAAVKHSASSAGASKPAFEAMNKKPSSDPGPEPGQNADDKVSTEREQGSRSSRKANGKRGKKQVVESSESFESDSSLDVDTVDMNGDTLREQRRSARNKRHVSYNENGSDDEDTMNPSKRAKEGGLSSPPTEKDAAASGTQRPPNPSKHVGSASASIKEESGGFDKSDATKKSSEADDDHMLDSSSEATPEPTFHEYPDPEFCDFDKDREECCFKVGQLWAAYDTVDAMPRFYARIRKILSPGFKIRITWLEPDPGDEIGKEWANAELPFSCGNFKFGQSENTEDRLMFSHVVSWEKGSGKESVKIYPRKGETWALFKNWDAKWHLVPENERKSKFEYEFVEILSEYDELAGIRVVHLGKLRGFASLFCQISGKEAMIPPSEILRFSHKVPSYRMTGHERNDVPPGSYELDPASITMNLEEVILPKQNVKPCVIDLSSNIDETDPAAPMAKKSAPSCLNDGKSNQGVHVYDLDGNTNARLIPDAEFFNFDGLKSPDKFEVNQLWALYSDVDSLPKYYALVKKIDPQPNFMLHISWLEACYLPSDMVMWKDKKMPISCGQFKVKSGKPNRYRRTSAFSHQLLAVQKGKKNVFDIYPRIGDVWALYKNWCPDMAPSDLPKCQYIIVQVLEDNRKYIKVLVLERVAGFNSVFKPQKNGSSSVTIEIPHVELLRFSHQIPSFRLTDEKGGKLRGFWELDTAALPEHLYKSK